MKHQVHNLPVLLLQLEQVPDDPSGLGIHPGSWFIQKDNLGTTNESNAKMNLSFHSTWK